MDSEQTSLSPEQFLGVVRRRAPLIVLCVIIFAGVAYGYSKSESKKYTAAAELAFDSGELDQQIAGLSVGTSLTPLAQEQSNLELVRVGDVAAKTARLLGHGLTEEKVRASLNIASKGETNIVGVSATSTSPVLAAAIANTYAGEFVKERQRTNRQFFKSALALVRKQLAELSPAQRVGADGLDLQNRAHTLALLAELGFNDVEVAQEALVPSSPSSPRVHRDAAIGVILGLLLGLALAFLREHFNRRITGTEELEVIYGLPVLGLVPKAAALSRPAGKHSARASAEAEVFSLIRARLRFFNIDRNLCTVLLASPAPGDGKTTIARHLAEAAARFGSRALLLECDLRRPTLAQLLGIQAGPGLADVLAGTSSIAEATQKVSLGGAAGVGAEQHTLDVLVAGAVPPPNPGELLESKAMGVVLEQAKSAYDLVVIDTSPLVAVSDGFPLLTKVDGVMIVGWVGRSRRDTAEELQTVLAGSGAPLLGVIANGTKTHWQSSYAKAVGTGSTPTAAPSSGDPTPEEFLSTPQT